MSSPPSDPDLPPGPPGHPNADADRRRGHDLAPLAEIHRDHDGYVSLAAADSFGNWTELVSLPARELKQRYLPTLAPVLDGDSFASVHGMRYRGRQRSQIRGPTGQLLWQAQRSRSNAQYLTACYTDLDCHRLNADPGTVIGEIINLEQAESIPRVSVTVLSGRGVWLLWLLHDRRDTSGPPRAYPERLVRLWCAVQHTIAERFGSYGSDPKCRTNLAQLIRTPGSRNSKAAEAVEYWVHKGPSGRTYSYTLPALAEAFGVPRIRETATPPARLESRQQAQGDGRKNPAKQAAGRAGHRRRWQLEIADLYRLVALRGTIGPGSRNFATMLLALALKGSGSGYGEALAAVEQLRLNFDQPPREQYTAAEAAAVVRSVFRRKGSAGRMRSPSRQTIADSLDVTPNESAVLAHWPPASRFGSPPAADATLTRSEARQLRRSALAAEIAERDQPVPTLAELVTALAARGIEAAPNTVRNDLAALGIANPRRRPSKPPPAPPR